ncbi:MAG: epimerase [Segetibacter sp.]|nr:epimerase [Segetibacter sp.]
MILSEKDNVLNEDFENILVNTKDLWHRVKDKTIFVTGGTGFFGVWLLKSFLFINEKLNLNAKMVVLTRSRERFGKKFPELMRTKFITFLEGNVIAFDFPEEEIHFIIHAATDASVQLNNEDPLLMLDTIVKGTRRVLDLAVDKKVEGFLFTSSGAVYGVQPSEITHINEDYIGAPVTNQHTSAYGEGKRMAELLCSIYSRQHGINAKIARCFAFIGPYLPIDSHFAIGNFIRDILTGSEINIQGDGTPYRSYMYGSDLVIWLFHILFNGKTSRAYNVGSDEALSIEQLSRKVSSFSKKNSSINIALPKTNNPSLRYVPSIERAKKELGLSITVPLTEAIDKTIRFYSDTTINI